MQTVLSRHGGQHAIERSGENSVNISLPTSYQNLFSHLTHSWWLYATQIHALFTSKSDKMIKFNNLQTASPITSTVTPYTPLSLPYNFLHRGYKYIPKTRPVSIKAKTEKLGNHQRISDLSLSLFCSSQISITNRHTQLTHECWMASRQWINTVQHRSHLTLWCSHIS